jgi:hypothetical protein
VGSESARKIAADRRHQYAVAGGEAGDRCAHLGDGADGLVAEDPPVGHGLHVAVEDVQVGPADRGGLDPDDDVGRATLARGRLVRMSHNATCLGLTGRKPVAGVGMRW